MAGTARVARGLLGASHPGPALAVTVLAALLAVAAGLDAGTAVLVTVAVAVGQLSIGWSNDLLDAARDRRVGRTDKPLAAGAVEERVVRLACAAAVVAVVPLSLACGLRPGLVHLLVVASGWAYNLGLKSTAWSWAPYAVAFGALPVFVSLVADPGLPSWWVPAAGALLGVGAHLVNVLPDLADDAATGVRGLPHRLGATWTQRLAVAVLVVASLVVALGGGLPPAVAVVGLSVVAALAVWAALGRGRAPFLAAVLIALTDVVMLVGAR